MPCTHSHMCVLPNVQVKLQQLAASGKLTLALEQLQETQVSLPLVSRVHLKHAQFQLTACVDTEAQQMLT